MLEKVFAKHSSKACIVASCLSQVNISQRKQLLFCGSNDCLWLVFVVTCKYWWFKLPKRRLAMWYFIEYMSSPLLFGLLWHRFYFSFFSKLDISLWSYEAAVFPRLWARAQKWVTEKFYLGRHNTGILLPKFPRKLFSCLVSRSHHLETFSRLEKCTIYFLALILLVSVML